MPAITLTATTAAAAATAVPLITGLIAKLGSAKKAAGVAKKAGEAAYDKTKMLGDDMSLTEFTNITRNDFLTLVEDDLLSYSDLNAILDRLQTMASGYYLSAVSLLVDIPNVDVIGKLDQLSSNRGGHSIGKSLGRESFGVEGLEYGLPPMYMPSNPSLPGVGCETFLGVENLKTTTTTNYDENGNVTGTSEQINVDPLADQKFNQDERKFKHQQKVDAHKMKSTSKYQSDFKNLQTIEEQSNLATGKLLQVTFEQDGNSTTVQVQVRLSVISTDSESMESILTFGGDNNTFLERYYRWRAGEIKFWKELLLQNDLIEEAMRARARDKSGFFRHMMQRRVGNTRAAAQTGKPSINNASGIMVITSETAKSIEDRIGGSLDQPRIRENVFKSTSCMLLAVVDRRWNAVTIYHRGLKTHTELSIRDIKRSKGGAGDVDDALRSYIEGTAPSF